MQKIIISFAIMIVHLTLCSEIIAQDFNFKKYLFDPPSTLSINAEEINKTSGYVRINGVEVATVTGPFVWNWGDGTSNENGWFPMEHTYSNVTQNYIVTVTSNYPGGATDEAEALVRFVAPSITPITLSDIISVKIPNDNMTLGTRTFPGYVPPVLSFFDDNFFTFTPRSTLEYILSVAATIQMDFVNDNAYLFEDKFEQYMLREATFGGAFSLWFSDPVAFGVGDVFMEDKIGYSSLFHEMGHNFTLNSPADFYFGGRIDGNANAIYSEAMAQIFQHATGYEIVNNYDDYGLSEDLRLEIKQQVIETIKLVRNSYEDYISFGKPFTSWNDDSTPGVDEAFLTFMTIAYKFFEHAENADGGYLLPLKRMMTFLQGFCEDWATGYDRQNNSTEGNSFRATLMVRALSEAFETDLREEFRALNFPIDDDVYEALPVELALFTASVDNGSVCLHWRTETEKNNYGFEVERALINSKSAILNSEFKKIGFVTGHGNSNSPKQYYYTDDRPYGGNKFGYRLRQIDTDGKFEYSGIIEIELSLDKFTLHQNFPNPLNPTTTIGFGIPKQENVRLSVVNILGEEIQVLVNEEIAAGYHSADFNAVNLPSGVYFYRITAGNFIETKKMMLLK